jgi:hypothetical protein
MAEANQFDKREEVRLEDVVEVGTRVSWGAILAGAVMALAVCFVLQLAGQAIGISLSDRTSGDTLGFWAAIWAVVTSMIGLFAGGWITSQCVVGETKTESVVHGIIMWGVALAFMLWGTASGISSNFTGMMQVASMAGVTTEPGTRQYFQGMATGTVPQDLAPRVSQSRDTRDTNASNDRRDDAAAASAPAAATSAPIGTANNGEYANGTRPDVASDRATTRATWWILATTVLSIVSAIFGAYMGAGPEFRLLPLHVSHRHFSGRGAVAGGA